MSRAAPRLSVLMAIRDAERFLQEAVDSLLAQTFTDFEAILVDDGSRDASADVLAGYRDPRLRVLRNPTNEGLPAALNRALGAARAPLLARMDADDVAAPRRFERQVAVMSARPDLDVLGTWTVEIDEEGAEVGGYSFPPCQALIRWGMARTNVVYHPTTVLRRAILDHVGGYRVAVDVAEDYDLFTRILRAGGTIDILPERLLRYRRHAGQTSSASVTRQRKQASEIRRLYVAWLTGADRPASLVDAAVELQAPWGRTPPPEMLGPALALQRALRRGAASRDGREGRRRVEDHGRRALLRHATRLRAAGRRSDARRVWFEALHCARAWRARDALAEGLALLLPLRPPAAAEAE